jgi:membrane-bound lytic murein transglycosylase D
MHTVKPLREIAFRFLTQRNAGEAAERCLLLAAPIAGLAMATMASASGALSSHREKAPTGRVGSEEKTTRFSTSVGSNVAFHGWRWLCCPAHSRTAGRFACFALAASIMAGCASSPRNMEPFIEHSRSQETVEAVAKEFPVTPAPRIDDQSTVAGQANSAALLLGDTISATNLWTRIRLGFGIPDLEGAKVREATQWYANRHDYLHRMTRRSQKYLFHVVEELERRKMPSELALLPFVESAFNPSAVSSARAAGLWQFIPSTGRDFALKQNALRDDRRDVLASTRAALDYLQKLHSMFGDWHLALAAYNWGEGNVGRAIARNQRAGLPSGYTDLNMPMETRSYVPKLQAVKNIMSKPDEFGIQLPAIENHPYFQSVTISRDMDTAVAARFAGVPLDEFLSLNPAANHPVILSAAMPKVLLPWRNANLFRQNLAAHRGQALASWTAWVVPSTMRPSTAAKNVGMAEADLRRINRIPPGKSVKGGSTLLVRRKSTLLADVSGTVAENAELVLVKTQQPPRQNAKRSTKPIGKATSRQQGRRGHRTRV